MDRAKVFENIIKITSNRTRKSDQDVLIEPHSLTHITIKATSKENLPHFLKDVEALIVILDNLTIDLYQLEIGPNLQAKYESLLRDLKQKDMKLKYLSSFFETTAEKIVAAKKTIEEKEAKITEAEDRKKRIDESLKNIRDRTKKQKKLKIDPIRTRGSQRKIKFPTRFQGTSSLKIQNPAGVVLNLVPFIGPPNEFELTGLDDDEQENWDENDEWLDDEQGFDFTGEEQ